METCQRNDTLFHVVKRIKRIYESDDLDVIQVLKKF